MKDKTIMNIYFVSFYWFINFIRKLICNTLRIFRCILLILEGAKIPLFLKIDGGFRINNPRYLRASGLVRIGPNSDFFLMNQLGDKNHYVEFSNGSYIGRNFHLVATSKIMFGEYLLVANNVFISNCRHGTSIVGIPFVNQELYDYGNITIGNNVWIGENVSIIGAITIGDNVIIGNNENVTHNISSNSIFKNGNAIKRN